MYTNVVFCNNPWIIKCIIIRSVYCVVLQFYCQVLVSWVDIMQIVGIFVLMWSSVEVIWLYCFQMKHWPSKWLEQLSFTVSVSSLQCLGLVTWQPLSVVCGVWTELLCASEGMNFNVSGLILVYDQLSEAFAIRSKMWCQTYCWDSRHQRSVDVAVIFPFSVTSVSTHQHHHMHSVK